MLRHSCGPRVGLCAGKSAGQTAGRFREGAPNFTSTYAARHQSQQAIQFCSQSIKARSMIWTPHAIQEPHASNRKRGREVTFRIVNSPLARPARGHIQLMQCVSVQHTFTHSSILRTTFTVQDADLDAHTPFAHLWPAARKCRAEQEKHTQSDWSVDPKLSRFDCGWHVEDHRMYGGKVCIAPQVGVADAR